jgi:poly(A) polymerase/tRNA nucleotidyltransferase (CCA-adding enzyme)
VFEHCLYTCDFIEPTLILRLAALFHDIGKPETAGKKAKDKTRTTFHKHEVASSKLTREILERLKYAEYIIKEVTHLIRLHMYHYTSEFTDAAVRRFIIRSNINDEWIKKLDEFPLFKLREADRLGNGFKTVSVTEAQRRFQRRIIDVFNKSKGLKVEDLKINGHDIISTFKLESSPTIDKIKKFLLSRVLDKPELNNKKDLLKLTTEYLFDNNMLKIN